MTRRVKASGQAIVIEGGPRAAGGVSAEEDVSVPGSTLIPKAAIGQPMGLDRKIEYRLAHVPFEEALGARGDLARETGVAGTHRELLGFVERDE